MWILLKIIVVGFLCLASFGLGWLWAKEDVAKEIEGYHEILFNTFGSDWWKPLIKEKKKLK